uniref:Uncharacterized protein n=1 Tax=Arundo donax TaxID=35708 RepID=A0A0A9B9A9_ARUDO
MDTSNSVSTTLLSSQRLEQHCAGFFPQQICDSG